ncbi:Nse4-domain-containing protein [Aaosphaeria arxii CBS 175.79]|uniref:Non-structural maintenance of chromosomes element 4 n=1 Tax=Aaosphaeria arxii CBS 175.79 TaxID=1450172 RepID=A0A6A5XRN0_9PLEO|nr:Nse4-domain-containing protein [Aaosphaeria arxii CBS 175.79]KAF2015401.1 Nse4-domain-containing protein [Aaosphaeria arxii CBS 175.79]
MARLNTRLSSTPQTGRSSTVDSLYRDPTPASHQRVNGFNGASRLSSYSVVSPAPSSSSDKENNIPDSRENTPKPTQSNRSRLDTTRLMTPTSGGSSSRSHTGHGNKRRRTGDYSLEGSSPGIYEDEDASEEGDNVNGTPTGDDIHEDEGGDEDDEENTKYYDPQQDPELRRQVRANIRKNHREMEDNRDELIKPDNNLLLTHLRKQDHYMGKVKQTADAALDARVIVFASDLANKKLNNSLNGNNGVGIDIDQFVSRCIHFMNSGGDIVNDDDSRTQTRRGGFQQDEDESGDGLDWGVLGRGACYPNNVRPPVSSFLLGPLSVQRRARTTQARRARSQRQPLGPATRPQELSQSDIKQSENANLSHMVNRIRTILKDHIDKGVERVEEELNEIDGDPDSEDEAAACRRHRVQRTEANEPAVSLFDFAINPNSFGQTVENLFYVSFLIRESNASIEQDGDGLPVLVPAQPYSVQEQRERKIEKHQAVFRIDWPTWKELIDAFDIKTSLIPHRVDEETNVTSGGWYG